MGYSDYAPQLDDAVIEEDIKVESGKKHFLRGNYSKKNGKLFAKLSGHQGSHILSSFAKANCFIIIDATDSKSSDFKVTCNSTVKVRLLS
jgi:molybdopterin molybdotransferase